MSEHKITVNGGDSVRLPTAGKYCDRDIVITAEGQDTSDATATARDIRFGVSAYVNGEKLEGSLRVAYGGISGFVEPTNLPWMGAVGLEKSYDEPIAIYPEHGSMISLKASYDAFGDATAADVAKGKTFTGAGGFKVEGEAEIGGGSYEIFGSHVIAPEWGDHYIVPEDDVTIEFPAYTAFANFRNGYGNVLYDTITSIKFRADGTITITGLYGGGYRLEYDGSHWKAAGGEGEDEFVYDIDDANRVVMVYVPVEVTKEGYTLLQGLFAYDEDEDATAYDIGHQVGYQVGYDANEEILSELMEWSVTTDSGMCSVSVINKHYDKWLLANLEIYCASGEEFFQDVLIPPRGNNSYAFNSELAPSEARWMVDIVKVRFSTDGN